MKTIIADPWSNSDSYENKEISENHGNSFEDSFVLSVVETDKELIKLPDSEQYLQRLQYRLKAIQGGTSKRDLINSLADAKADCIARLITAGQNFETAEEREFATNPLIRHIAPHLQALTASELIHLLKADVLQAAVDEQNNQSVENEDSESKSTESSQSDIQIQDSNGL